ncbi:MAG: dienelactone hydrolase family protein, partial [Burkholderiaceae bacterium]|nr:dienelactone hydrolase family protein [Burkholderiaceae bacterium]
MNSEWILVTSSDGHQFDAYVSHPPAGRGPGLLIIQEIFGVNEHIRAVADQYAADGFVVIAPDVFWRESRRVELAYDTAGFERGLGLMNRLNIARSASDLQRSVEAVKHLDSCSGLVGSVGFCMGGLLSYVAAARAGVDTAVCYYGGGIDQHLDLAEDITCPILLHFAQKDAYISATSVNLISQALDKHPSTRIITHPGVD